MIENYCSENGISSLNLLDAFQESGIRTTALRLNAIDNHPNVTYNELVADTVAPNLMPMAQ